MPLKDISFPIGATFIKKECVPYWEHSFSFKCSPLKDVETYSTVQKLFFVLPSIVPKKITCQNIRVLQWCL